MSGDASGDAATADGAHAARPTGPTQNHTTPIFMAQRVFIVAAKRTAFGTFGGALKNHTATDLMAEAFRATLAATGKSGIASHVDSVVVGNVQQTDANAAYLPRHAALRAAVPEPVPALGVNRLCGSGFQAVVTGALEIQAAQASLVLAGGSESMSQAPYAVRNIRWGTTLGHSPALEDTLWQGLTDNQCKLPMGNTAENLAEKYGITRKQSDEYSVASQQRWAAAHKAGVFKAEIAPMTLKSKKGDVVFEVDEHPRPNTTLEGLAKLPTLFKKENGTVTAGAASGICDGAAGLLLASEAVCTQHGLKPLARVAGWACVGVDPKIMGIGPVPAIQALLAKAKLKLGDVARIEINEAFAPQYLACEKALGLDRSITNANGGAIALGHPLGASGARILTHLTHEFGRLASARYMIGAACIGGGQGIAVLLERV